MLEQRYIADPCPVCKKPDAARQGSSAWGHNYMVCSEACGLALRAGTLRRAELDFERAESAYKDAKAEFLRCRRQVVRLKLKEEGVQK